MESKLILLKKENTSSYSVYYKEKLIGTIVDGLKLDIFGWIKRVSKCVITINDKIYYLKFVNNCAPRYSLRFKSILLSIENKRKIAELDIIITFFDTIVFSTFFCDDKINYLKYSRYGTISSEWKDINNNQVISFKKNNLLFNDKIIKDKLQDLDLIIMFTILIEKFVVKKTRQGLYILILFSILSIPIIAFVYYLYSIITG